MPGMLAGRVTKLCQRGQKKQLSEITKVTFNIQHSQSSANTRLVATHDKSPGDEKLVITSKMHTPPWHMCHLHPSVFSVTVPALKHKSKAKFFYSFPILLHLT